MTDSDRDPPRDERSRPRRLKGDAGPDIYAGRAETQTEKDLRRVEGHYDPESVAFDPKMRGSAFAVITPKGRHDLAGSDPSPTPGKGPLGFLG
jgi:hypothetical protein